ncbi:MAG TPA: GNAT family N-acetyltransferase [Gaiellaceae bacterium]|nr:GNAT family N-acetyltransferase [Gaiellaceae bacterium]
MAGDAVIRELREPDAAAVARLRIAINPHQVVTPATLWHRASCTIERERRRDWVADVRGEIVGCAQAGFEWSVPTPGKGYFWIGVHPERRVEGIGGALYATAREYLLAEGAVRLRTWVDADLAGERFVRKLGFEPRTADRVSEVDPRSVDVTALPRLEERGFRLAPLAQVLDRVRDLYEICAAGERDMPSDEAETELDLESWKRDELDLPDLSHEGSFVALDGERPVALAFLRVDPERRIAYNQMTATLPEYRRRGLALMVKLAAARWAAEARIERLLTENDVGNTAMLAINDRLGYRPLYEQRSWVLELERERPAGERG